MNRLFQAALPRANKFACSCDRQAKGEVGIHENATSGRNLNFMHVIAVTPRTHTYVYTYIYIYMRVRTCPRPLICLRRCVTALTRYAPSTPGSERHLDCNRRKMPRALQLILGASLALSLTVLAIVPLFLSNVDTNEDLPMYSLTPLKN